MGWCSIYTMFMIPVLIGVSLFAYADKIVPKVKHEVLVVRSKIKYRRYMKAQARATSAGRKSNTSK